MWFLKLLEIFCIFSVQFFPILVDTGLQIWNGVTINEMVFERNMEWTNSPTNTTTLPSNSSIVFRDTRKKRDVPCESEDCILRIGMEGDGGTFDPNEDSVIDIDVLDQDQGDGVRSNFISIYISESMTYDVNYEAIVSIALLQFPAICLAFFGIIRAFLTHGLSCSALRSSIGALLLIFMPFCFMEFFVLFEFEFSQESLKFVLEKLKTGVEKLVDLVCGQGQDRCIQSMDLLHFLPAKDADKRDRMLSVQLVKIIFGTCIQLCFQSCLLLGYTEVKNIQISQILSIVSSCLVICKVGVEIIRFKRETVQIKQRNENVKLGEKMKVFFIEKLKSLKTFLIYFPLMFVSLVFNTGTLILAILVWEEFSVIYICSVFLLNFAVSLILPFGFIEKVERKMGIEYKFDMVSSNLRTVAQEKVTEPRVTRGVLVSWTNIFFLSRPVEDTSYFRTIHVVLLQILRLLLNLITLFVMIGFVIGVSSFEESLKIKLLHSIILLILMGILTTILVFIYTYNFNCCGKSESYEPNKLEESENEEKIPLTTINNVSVNKENETDILESDDTNQGNDNINDTRENSEDEEDKTEQDSAEETNLTILDQSTASNTQEDENKGDANIDEYKQVNNEDEKKEVANEDKSLKIPKLQRMTSADGSCAIQDADLDFIGKHSKLSNEDVKKHFTGLLSDGRVDKEVFKKIVEMCYPDLDTDRLEKHIFKVFDEERNGLIEFRKFMLVIYALSSGTPEENLKQIFKLVDRNSDDEITVEEFKDVVHDIFVLANERKVSVSLENQLVSKAFSEMDTNADGKVVLDEFIKACKRHNYIVITYIKNFAETYNHKRSS